MPNSILDVDGYSVVRMYAYDRSMDVFSRVSEVGRYGSPEVATFWLGVRARSFGLCVEGFDNDGGRALFGVRMSGELGDEYWYVVRKGVSE